MSDPTLLPHLFVTGRAGREPYVYAGPIPRGEVRLPPRDRAAHGNSLLEQLNQARQENERQRGMTTSPNAPGRIVLQIASEPGFELELDSLEPRSQGVELACFRVEDDVRYAVIHVPEGKLVYFIRLVERYLSKQTRKGEPQHQKLLSKVAAIRLATLRSFWTDEPTDFPAEGMAIWWEVWLRTESDQGPWDTFRMLAESAELQLGAETIRFPDRLVCLCYGTSAQLSSTGEILDLLGEVRRAKENPSVFVEMSPQEQGEWVNLLLGRIVPPGIDAPSVCILDAGIISHPLIQTALAPEDVLRYDPTWPLTDESTHGTEMAGIALFGDQLPVLLKGEAPVTLQHRLESVKILPPPPLQNDPRLFGAITAQAVYRVESQIPTRLRTFCMALTTDGRDRGRPTSWSGEIDQLGAGVHDGQCRLLFLSAGNVSEDWHEYPDVNDTEPVQDPGQAWNAVTVGAYTELVQFPQSIYPGYEPIARAGDLAPSSTTSLTFDADWPYKPDLVLEGGNAVVEPVSGRTDTPEQMSLLTTAHASGGRLLVGFGDTSAATAQAARMSAIIEAEYPRLWPETVRALLIHSAEWTTTMSEAFDDPELGLSDKGSASGDSDDMVTECPTWVAPCIRRAVLSP